VASAACESARDSRHYSDDHPLSTTKGVR
jgi:hypothetical protein